MQTILLYLNINFPSNVVSFINYLNCVNNGIPEISNYIPDASEYLLSPSQIELQYYYNELPAKFNQMNVEIFLIVNFGRTISINAAAIFIAIPVLIGLNSVCGKI